MIPLSDIMDDIRTLMRAAVVRLPASCKELGDLFSKQQGREEEIQTTRELVDPANRERARLGVGTIPSIHNKVEEVKDRSMATGTNEDSHNIEIDVTPRHPKPFEDFNTLPQNDTLWPKTLPVPGFLDSVHYDSSELSDSDDNILNVKYKASKIDKSRTGIPWTLEENGRLTRLREGGASWDEIMKTPGFSHRPVGEVKKHWYKELHHADTGKSRSALHTWSAAKQDQ